VFDTVKVTVLPKVIAYAGNDTIVSTNLPHQLLATGGVSYLWSPANVLNNATIANPIAIVSRDTRMIVQVKNALSCSAYDTIWLRVLPGINYYVPNAFSPNGDGVNDVFRATSVGIVSTQYFRIFNRYGELVFETNQIGKGWDGTFKNKPQAVGNYVWVIKGIDKNGKSVERKGNLVLIR
jgi:gliding motility-associated-like protein